MKRLIIIAISLALAATPTMAGITPEYAIAKFTVDGGGGTSSGGVYSLTGTIGQFDASVQKHTGGNFVVSGGFWNRLLDVLFKDSFEDL